METSTSADHSLALRDGSQPSPKHANYEEEVAAELTLFANLNSLLATLQQSRSQHSDLVKKRVELLQQEHRKHRTMKNTEFSASHITRKESFDKVQATELQQFEEAYARKESEFKKAQAMEEEQRLQQQGINCRHSPDPITLQVQAEQRKLRRQAEDEHEESQLRYKQNGKMARREREDHYEQSEARHLADHRDALERFQHELGAKLEKLLMGHNQQWRERNKKIRAQIKHAQSALMRQVFGSPGLQHSSTLKPVLPNLDIQTPPPDISTGSSEQIANAPMVSEPLEQTQNGNISTLDPQPSSLEDWSMIDTVIDADPTSDKEHETIQVPGPSIQASPDKEHETSHTSAIPTQPPKVDLNQSQSSTLRPQYECQIQAARMTLERLGADCGRKIFWQDVASQMEKQGYTIGADSAASLWSSRLRQVCESRGYAWAEAVMKRAPYKTTRKRRTLSTGDATVAAAPASSSSRSVKRPKTSLSPQNTIEIQNNLVTTKEKTPQVKSFNGGCIWEGASYDVTELDWSPDGERFIVGSMAMESPVHQNASCNLAVGSISSKTLRELPNTHLTYGESVHDKDLYRSVTAARFSASGGHAVTAGYDSYVRIWDLRQDDQPLCIQKLEHKNKVIVMAYGKATNLLATGIEAGSESLQIWHGQDDFTDFKSVGLPYHKVKGFNESPMCLAFGNNPATQDWLAAGFAWDGVRPADGRLGVWSIDQGCLTERSFKPDHQQVFDVAWFPTGKGFVAGTSSSAQSSRERTCVQIYNINERDSNLKLTCPAKDMNMVTICPFREEIVTASCTDGKVYVWDMRNTKDVLHTLSHATPLRRCGGEDVGVGMTDWLDAYSLFTGGSDGMLKRWDPRLSKEDVLVENVYDCCAEIMSGRFCPDKSALLLGDADESLHLLQKKGSAEQPPTEEFTFIAANNRRADKRTPGIILKRERASVSRLPSESSLFDGTPEYFPPEHVPSVI